MLLTFLYLVFVFAAITLGVSILLQEGRGGGLGTALGDAGRETFGVGTRGIQLVTAATALVFLLSGVLVHVLGG